MRVLLAFALFGLVAGKEETCPITKWLKEHGEDVFETVVACKDVPMALKEAWASNSKCTHKPTARDRVAMAVWIAIFEMQHLNGTLPDMVKQSKTAEKINDLATTQLISSAHKSLDSFCSHGECNDQGKKLSSVISPCYGSLVCNFMTKFVPFAACKDTFAHYIDTVVNSQMDSACDNEEVVDLHGGHKYYCAEMQADLVYKDMECFIEYKTGGVRGCTPRCVSQWEAMSNKFPKCSKQFLGATEQYYETMRAEMQKLAASATDPNFKEGITRMPKSLASYDDICMKNSGAAKVMV
jgi:hypothetical protein|mmetsp:Transcript_83010/g.130952  ORF Transcript_83010/g.130952 Transcript_83010/m.130952 type:complete len:296 (+) Transcript_83010:97-984(+)